MPRLHLKTVLCALFASGTLAGCTTAELVPDTGLQPQLFSFDDADPVLPDAVDDVPFPVARAAAAGDVPEAAAALSAASAASPDFVPAAFAGPTPDNPAQSALAQPRRIAARSPELDALIARYADHHGIPVALLRRVVERESTFNPAARNGPYWGLMQILPQTAQSMGYRGTPEGLLDAETNLLYAGKYLRGAYLVADGNHDLAVRYYARGYYYHARDRGMLEVTGLGKDRRKRMPETLVAANQRQAGAPAPANAVLGLEGPGIEGPVPAFAAAP